VCTEVLARNFRLLQIKGTSIKYIYLSKKISFSLSNQVQFIEKVLELSRKQIHNIHHGVRVECLKLIGLLSHVTDDTEIPLSILEDNCHDADPRVRTAAFQALVSGINNSS
jgi:integrator complex subunit 4